MSKNDMVMVPRELRSVLSMILNALDRDASEGKAARGEMAEELRAILGRPADQHHGEPVAQVVSKHGDPEAFGEREIEVLADLSKIAYNTKLYTHSDPAEVERLRKACEAEFRSVETLNEDNQKLRAQLAEAHALLRDAQSSHGRMLMTDPPQDPWKVHKIGERISEFLSASKNDGRSK